MAVLLIFNARRYRARPKAYAVWFAVAVSVFALLITVATIYSGIALEMTSADAAKQIPVIAFFACTVTAFGAYREARRRFTSSEHSR